MILALIKRHGDLLERIPTSAVDDLVYYSIKQKSCIEGTSHASNPDRRKLAFWVSIRTKWLFLSENPTSKTEKFVITVTFFWGHT